MNQELKTTAESEIIAQTVDHVRRTLQGDSTGHDWWHIERVWHTALNLARLEGADLFVVQLAALLHDIADWKFHGGDDTVGPRAAREWLTQMEVDPGTIDHVCDIIAHMSFKGAGVPTPMASLEGRVVQDADRLDTLGAIGIARTFAYGAHTGQPLYNPDAAPVAHTSFAEYKKNSGSSLNHFYEKLFLLKDRMNTAAGRRIAAERHAFMEEFVKRFLNEWNGGE